ncbi:hypothetical protein N7475_006812 [Penicillium sp. IBT 31633x]|nr:hypothetical protein N7475_006812 [Penicillium sp. IBT 31633x]
MSISINYINYINYRKDVSEWQKWKSFDNPSEEDHSFFVHFTPVHKIGYAMTLELVHLQLMQEIYNADAFTSNLQHMLNMNKGVERG